MNTSKEISLIRKRNADLARQNEELKNNIEIDKVLNQNSFEKAKTLIAELDETQNKWNQLIEDLEEQKSEYQELIEVCKDVKEIIGDTTDVVTL